MCIRSTPDTEIAITAFELFPAIGGQLRLLRNPAGMNKEGAPEQGRLFFWVEAVMKLLV
jgi:hypothetical protein